MNDKTNKNQRFEVSLRTHLNRCETGSVMVEVAILLPLLITLFIGIVDFSRLMMVERRVSAIAISAADIIARRDTGTSVAELSTLASLGGEMMYPFDPSNLTVAIASVLRDADDNINIDWSYPAGGSGDVLPLPDSRLTQFHSNIIVTTVSYQYTPIITGSILGPMTRQSRTYLSPRFSGTVQCNDC